MTPNIQRWHGTNEHTISCYDNLKAVMTRARLIFSSYQLDPQFHLRVSPFRTEAAKELMSLPLDSQEIIEPLAYYCFCSYTTMGWDEHFKHFLPTMMQHYVDAEYWHGYDTYLIGKIATRTREWPHEEREICRLFLKHLLLLGMTVAYVTFADVPDLVDEISFCEGELAPFFPDFETVTEIGNPVAIAALIQHFFEHPEQFEGMETAFLEWLETPALYKKLVAGQEQLMKTHAYAEYDEEELEWLQSVIDLLSQNHFLEVPPPRPHKA